MTSGVRWVAVRHAADHLHIVATLARQDGSRPRIWNDFYRVREACQQAEQQLGLRATAPADRTAARRATRAETEQSARRGWAEPPRVTLRREVSTAAAGARTEQDFYARLQQAGVLVRQRRSTIEPGAVTGYAVGLPQHTASGGGVIWYGGGKLAADLTLPKLRARWTTPAGDDRASGAGLSQSAARAVLRNLVTGAASQAPDEAGFFARLREAGVLVRLRFSDADPGQVTGYSVTLPEHTGHDGAALWYGGGRLEAGLTLPRLRDRWGHPRNDGPERRVAFRFTAPERNAIYGHAARQAAAAAEHIRRCAHGDPSGAADAAWAAADTLHVAARVLRSPALRCAADAYDRAARSPHGRVPHRTRDGDQLRATARLVALLGNVSRRPHACIRRAHRESRCPGGRRRGTAPGPAARRAGRSGPRSSRATARHGDAGPVGRPTAGSVSCISPGRPKRCRYPTRQFPGTTGPDRAGARSSKARPVPGWFPGTGRRLRCAPGQPRDVGEPPPFYQARPRTHGCPQRRFAALQESAGTCMRACPRCLESGVGRRDGEGRTT